MSLSRMSSRRPLLSSMSSRRPLLSSMSSRRQLLSSLPRSASVWSRQQRPKTRSEACLYA
eukprot:8658273-Lingulodinium_polyedra.AAC.1